jgi:hypothetical protein
MTRRQHDRLYGQRPRLVPPPSQGDNTAPPDGQGEFPPELCTAPPGFRIEVMVQMHTRFTNGDSLRLRWPMLVPIEEGLQ